jgi:hypothetical protein
MADDKRRQLNMTSHSLDSHVEVTRNPLLGKSLFGNRDMFLFYLHLGLLSAPVYDPRAQV